MNTTLQDKLQKMMEDKRLLALSKQLTSFECIRTVQTNEFPPSITGAIEIANNNSTPRNSRISCNEQIVARLEWVREIFITSGIGEDHFYLSTGLRFYPWIEVKTLNDEWVRNLNDISRSDFYAISSKEEVFLAVANEEHWLDAYWCDL